MQKRSSFDKPPFRRLNRGHLLDDATLDDDTRRALMRDVRAHVAPALSTPSVSQTPPTSEDVGDLFSVMASRLRSMEEKHRLVHIELRTKATEIISLTDRLREETRRRVEAEDRARDLERHTNDAEGQLKEIKAFLEEYGLVWVGEEGGTTQRFDLYQGNYGEEGIAPISTAAPEKAVGQKAEAKEGPPFNVENFSQQCHELTLKIGFNRIGTDGRHHIIAERETVRVVIYRNGITVNRGPLRPYGWPLCDAFVGDVLEGYYPYEFKDRYPDGFPIEVSDKSAELCPTEPNGARVHGLEGRDGPISRAELLRRLPERYVTAGGQLINVRSAIKEHLEGGTAVQRPSDKEKVAESGANGAPHSPIRCEAERAMREDPTKAEVTVVRIHIPTGETVTLHMFFSDTIGDLRRELRKLIGDGLAPEATVCSVFPRRTYDDDGATLLSLGLVPNCALMVRPSSTQKEQKFTE